MDKDEWRFAPGETPKKVRGPVRQEFPATPPTPAPPPPPPVVTPPTPQPHQVAYQGAPRPVETNGMAVAALVLGIVGLLLPILSVLALIFGGIGMSKANQGASGKGMAVAGLVLGILGTLVLIAAISETS